ncbi:hypothetical protein Sango_0653000 [Sesamum angolense]|uniref:Reverse transcriptase domain-containing protein n=1 Tax=Sesamum angolense TaxID=2727404 RepID=A0AAE1X709_9LAMI|nr:hypothetical protein Sango_0653000 [Sesamum angolense]
MCTDFTDVNKTWPKDPYPLPRIDLLADSTVGCAMFSATYQRLVNKMFKDLIGKTMEVYVDDMLVKSKEEEEHLNHLQAAFEVMRRRLVKWVVELGEFNIEYQYKTTIKAQVLANFVVELAASRKVRAYVNLLDPSWEYMKIVFRHPVHDEIAYVNGDIVGVSELPNEEIDANNLSPPSGNSSE